MSYCLNPQCQRPQNPDGINFCLTCGTKLFLKERYQAVSLLGEGGFGRTYRAIDTDRMNEECVIKQFLPSPEIQGNSVALKKAVELFNQEAVRLYELGKHDRIPNLLAYFEQDKRLYLIQELVNGVNLLNEWRSHGNLSEEEIWQFLADILPVLQFIHEHGVIHRDIKPENIMRRTHDKALVLIDFGVSKQAAGTVISGARGTMAGTPGYAPDEQIRFGEAYPASDLYALGATCLHLLTGSFPNQLYNPWESRWTWKEYLQQQGKSVSNALSDILDRLIKDRVGDRYQSAADVLRDVETHNPAHLKSTIISQNPVATAPTVAVNPVRQNTGWSCISTLTGHATTVRAIAVTRDGKTIASGSDDNRIKIWHREGGNLLQTLSIPPSLFTSNITWFSAIAFSSDGQTLISGGLDKKIRLWDWQNNHSIKQLNGHKDAIYALSLSPDGQTLASGGRDNQVIIWDFLKTHRLHTLKGHTNTITSIAFTPDSQIIATASRDHTVKLWDGNQGRLLHTLDNHTDWVSGVCFSSDGQTLFSCSRDCSIMAFDVGTGRFIRAYTGHQDWVTAITINPVNNLLVSGSRDRTIKIWEINNNNREIQTLSGHVRAITSLTISPDHRDIISASDDGTIKIWRLREYL